MEPIETFEHNGYTVEIHYDEDGRDICNPRDCTTLGLFLGFPHRHYEIGDEEFNPEDFEEQLETLERVEDLRGMIKELEDAEPTRPLTPYEKITAAIKAKYGAKVVLKVGMIDHSGVSYYVGGGAHMCDPGGWDSGTCGFIFDTLEKRKECFGDPDYHDDDEIRRQLEAEIEEYDMWARGETYGYIIKNAEGDEKDACWGFLGDEYVKEAAKEAADCLPTEIQLELVAV